VLLCLVWGAVAVMGELTMFSSPPLIEAVGTASPFNLVATLAEDPWATPASVLFELHNPSSVGVWVSSTETPMEGVYSDIFDITDLATGQRVQYQGIVAKRGDQLPEEYTLLKPGQSIKRSALLGGAYAMRDGMYSVSGRVRLSVAVAASGQDRLNINATRYSITARTNTIQLKVSGYVPKSMQSNEVSSNRTTSGLLGATLVHFDDCSSSRTTIVNAAIAYAKGQLTEVTSYLDSSCDNQFVLLFGAYTGTSRWSTVETTYDRTVTRINGEFTIDCTPNNCPSESTYAYVYKYDSSHQIHLCNKFWQVEAQTGYDTQWGTLIHEFAHFSTIRGANDHTYGLSSCMSLAVSNPSQAVYNSDNYEYFAEQKPRCS